MGQAMRRTTTVGKKGLQGFAGVLVALTAVVLARTLLITPPLVLPPPSAVEQINETAAVAHLSAALKFATVSERSDVPADSAPFDGLLRFIESGYPMVHRTLEREQPGSHSVLYTWKGSEPDLPGILLIAHMDVVPVEPGSEALWTHAPFSGDVADGFVWGRGAVDMKASVIGILEAVEHLLKQGVQPKRTIYVALSQDEETGGENGAALIAARLHERKVRLQYTLDEGSYIVQNVIPGVARPVALIGIAEKGYLTLRLTAQAPGGHSSMPSRDEAIARIARALQRLERQPMPASLEGVVSPMLDALAPEMPFARRMVFANRWLFGPLLIRVLELTSASNALIRTTMVPTVIEGGIKDNVLPRTASVTINVRILPGDTIESVITHVRQAIDEFDIGIERVGAGNDPLSISSVDAPGFAVLRSAVEQVYPDAVVAPTLVIAGTDTVHYASLAENSYRFQPLRLEATDLERIHGVDERVKVSDLANMIRFYVSVMRTSSM